MRALSLWLIVLGCGCSQPPADSQPEAKTEPAIRERVEPWGEQEPVALRIAEVQGAAHYSPYRDRRVRVDGVVSAIQGRKVWCQDPVSDGAVGTSEGLLLSLPKGMALPSKGSLVTVQGLCREQISRNHPQALPVTTIVVEELAEEDGAPGLTPVVLGRDRTPPEQIMDDETKGHVLDPHSGAKFQPQQDGLDFWESLEGMLVQIPPCYVISGVQHGNEFVVALQRPRSERGGLILRADDPNPERVIVEGEASSLPALSVGWQITQALVGVVHYDWGAPRVILLEPITAFQPGPLTPEKSSLADDPLALRIASFNVRNFSADAELLPGQLASEHVRPAIENLGFPDLIGLQEMQDSSGRKNDGVVDSARTEAALLEALGKDYAYIDIAPVDLADGGVPGGNIRCAFLYRTERLSLVSRGVPSSFHSVRVDHDGRLSASPGVLFTQSEAYRRSRKPLIAEFSCGEKRLIVINVHLVSKRGDAPLFGAVQPPVRRSDAIRQEQAVELAEFVASLRKQAPDAFVVVLGDFNDFPWSKPLQTMAGVLADALAGVPDEDRYTYIYKGNAQQLDHIFVSPSWLPAVRGDIVHQCSEFSDGWRLSDHDPAVIQVLMQTKP